MSSSANDGTNGGQMNRQVAKRAFATEFEDASHIFQEGSSERSPKFAMLPTGERANRVLAMGTLTDVENIGSKSDYFQARVVGPTGTFFVYAGQYQPEAMAALRSIEAPAYVAVVGKPRSYETDDDETLVSLTPESINVVEQGTRDQWVIETAERTLERIDGLDGEIREGYFSEDNQRAIDAYGEDIPLGEYEQDVKEALAGVAGIDVDATDAEDESGEEGSEE